MGFRLGTVSMMAATAVAILAFNTLSLHVSAERAKVDRLQRNIAADLRDIRALEAELRTRARLPVLQKWNDSVLAMSAPTAKQFAISVQLAAFAPGAAEAAAGAPSVQLALATPETMVVSQPGIVKVAYEVPAAPALPREVVISYGTTPVTKAAPAKAAQPKTRDAKAEPRKPEAKPAEPVKLAQAKPRPAAKPPANPADLDALIGAIDDAAAGGGFQKVSMQ